jgi:hypothetical protein
MKKTAISFTRRSAPRLDDLWPGLFATLALLMALTPAAGHAAAGGPTSTSPATTAQASAHPPPPYQVKDKSMGVVNCAISPCHGSVQPWKDANAAERIRYLVAGR